MPLPRSMVAGKTPLSSGGLAPLGGGGTCGRSHASSARSGFNRVRHADAAPGQLVLGSDCNKRFAFL